MITDTNISPDRNCVRNSQNVQHSFQIWIYNHLQSIDSARSVVSRKYFGSSVQICGLIVASHMNVLYREPKGIVALRNDKTILFTHARRR